MGLESNWINEDDGKYYDELLNDYGIERVIMMNYTNHKEGKWYYSSGQVWADKDEKIGIAQRISDSPIKPHKRDKNMLLCSMAPELYEALAEVYCLVDLVEHDPSLAKRVGAILNKLSK